MDAKAGDMVFFVADQPEKPSSLLSLRIGGRRVHKGSVNAKRE